MDGVYDGNKEEQLFIQRPRARVVAAAAAAAAAADRHGD